MKRPGATYIADTEYKNSGRWKCDKSPTGAHHWLIHEKTQTCKFCAVAKVLSYEEPSWYSGQKRGRK